MSRGRPPAALNPPVEHLYLYVGFFLSISVCPHPGQKYLVLEELLHRAVSKALAPSQDKKYE